MPPTERVPVNSFQGCFRKRLTVQKRSLRVVKWIGQVPAIGVCTVCSREFKVPLTAMNRVRPRESPVAVHRTQVPRASRDRQMYRLGIDNALSSHTVSLLVRLHLRSSTRQDFSSRSCFSANKRLISATSCSIFFGRARLRLACKVLSNALYLSSPL